MRFQDICIWRLRVLLFQDYWIRLTERWRESKKNRTEDEKRFGIQIDSLCDIVCFGVFPTIICYFTGMRNLPGVLILMFYCLAGLIRLAYFNVMEERRQQETSENRKYYQGLPITTISVILPLVYVSSFLYPPLFL